MPGSMTISACKSRAGPSMPNSDIFSINNVLQTIKIENFNNKSLEKIFNLETYNPIQLCMFLVDCLDKLDTSL